MNRITFDKHSKSDDALRIVFAGTPEFAAIHLQALIASKHNVCAVYTQPDRPAGRGRKLTASPVKALALENEIKVYQPQSLKTEEARLELDALKADLMIVVAYGVILPKQILDTPTLGCINVHASILPRWRGAAPIHRAIEAGDEATGITIMQMDEGLDTGDMLVKSEIAIEPFETSDKLHDRLMVVGAETLIQTLDAIAEDTISAQSQDDSESTYAKKLLKAEAAINWHSTAEQIARKARAFTPWPGSTVTQNDQVLKVLIDFTDINLDVREQAKSAGTIIKADEQGIRVACSNGSVLISALQLPGKRMTVVKDILNAYQNRFEIGQKFDS